MDHLLPIIISLGISCIAAALSYYFPDKLSLKDSIWLGLLSYFISVVISISGNFDLLQKDITEIKATLNAERATKSRNNFDYYWLSCMDKSREGQYVLASKNCIKIPHTELRRFWQMAIANTAQSWECTLYVNDPEDLNSKWIRSGFELQGFNKKIFELSVKRLFIFDKREDITEDVITHLKWQNSIGVEVKVLVLENEKWAATAHNQLKELLGTIDIAIIDNSYLISFILKESTINNKNRRSLDFIELWSEQERVKKIQSIYSDMWSSSATMQQITQNNL